MIQLFLRLVNPNLALSRQSMVCLSGQSDFYEMECVMKLFWQLMSVAFVLVVAAACVGNADTAVSPQPEGPALIMFYTDN